MATSKSKKPAGQGLLDDPRAFGEAPAPKVEAPDSLYISRVTFRRFGGAGDDEMAFDFSPGANVLRGDNATGKTSTLAAIRTVLRMTHRSAQENAHILDDGEAQQKPEITLILRGEDREFVVRVLGDASPTVREKVGEDIRDVPRPVDFLKGLVDVAGADPAAFERAKPDDQVEMLLEALDFPDYNRAAALEAAGLAGFRVPPIPAGLHPLLDLEKIQTAVEDARRATGQERDTEKAAAARLLADLPAQPPKTVGDLEAAQAEVDALAATVTREEEAIKAGAYTATEAAIAATSTTSDRVQSDFDKEKARLQNALLLKAAELRAAAEKRIQELKAEDDAAIDDLRTKGDAELAAANAKLADDLQRIADDREKATAALKPKQAELQEKREALATARQSSEAIATDTKVRALAKDAKDRAEIHDQRWKWLDAGIRGLKRYAAELAGKLPIEGLTIRFDEKGKRSVLMNGKPIEKLSAAEMNVLAAKVAALRSGQGGTERALRIILIDEIGRITKKRRTKLLKDLEEAGCQIIAALADEDAPLEVTAA